MTPGSWQGASVCGTSLWWQCRPHRGPTRPGARVGACRWHTDWREQGRSIHPELPQSACLDDVTWPSGRTPRTSESKPVAPIWSSYREECEGWQVWVAWWQPIGLLQVVGWRGVRWSVQLDSDVPWWKEFCPVWQRDTGEHSIERSGIKERKYKVNKRQSKTKPTGFQHSTDTFHRPLYWHFPPPTLFLMVTPYWS